MKNILVAILFMASSAAIAQKLGEQAVFTECKKQDFPATCTEDKIISDITALLTADIITDIEKTINRNFFTVSVEFISDENGRIIPSETGIMCEDNAALKAAIEHYLTSLPPFTPKDKSFGERRSYTPINIVYLRNTDNENYHIAGYQELKTVENYKTFGPAIAPIYPGCEGAATKGEKMKCLAKGINQVIAKNFVMPNIQNPGEDKMHVSLLIAIDGKVRVEEIAGSSAYLRNELTRAVKKIPKVQPAEEKGIPVAVHLYLPLTLRVK